MQGGLVLDCTCSVKYGAFFTVARPFLDRRNFFHDFFGYQCFFKMKLKNCLVGIFSSGIGLVIEFHLQCASTESLKTFLKPNTLRSLNLCGLMTPNLIHTIYNESITRLYS